MFTYRTVVLHLSGLFTGEECWCGAEIKKNKLFLHDLRGRNEIRKRSQSLVRESMFSKIKLQFISERKRIDNRIK